MQYNDENGDIHITDSVNVAGATLSASGNMMLGSGTTYMKKVAAVSVYAQRANLSSNTSLTITVAANEAPNFINVQASAMMTVQSQGDIVWSAGHRAVTRVQASFPDLPVGLLRAYCRGEVAGGSGGVYVKYLESGSTHAISTVLIAGVDYNPAAELTIVLGPRVTESNYGLIQDAQHRLSLLCG